MALLWAAGILWLAYDVAGPDDTQSNGETNVTDVSGAPVTDADQKALQEALNSIGTVACAT
ncbi:hypothetical protein GCM10023264_13590 [Sphingomonas daechungensis]|uniref:Uncharacterized protein n=3 Tax=Sphingomonas daechungensis TaxID=1176646 RepID=A0ABX6T037_9SPHN|nr:hypothetical protein [Sphingomonas daechungensis]QNP42267.1 hypothetical protein H9L15_07760 [Sphingomonas daechungensis]